MRWLMVIVAIGLVTGGALAQEPVDELPQVTYVVKDGVASAVPATEFDRVAPDRLVNADGAPVMLWTPLSGWTLFQFETGLATVLLDYDFTQASTEFLPRFVFQIVPTTEDNIEEIVEAPDSRWFDLEDPEMAAWLFPYIGTSPLIEDALDGRQAIDVALWTAAAMLLHKTESPSLEQLEAVRDADELGVETPFGTWDVLAGTTIVVGRTPENGSTWLENAFATRIPDNYFSVDSDGVAHIYMTPYDVTGWHLNATLIGVLERLLTEQGVVSTYGSDYDTNIYPAIRQALMMQYAEHIVLPMRVGLGSNAAGGRLWYPLFN